MAYDEELADRVRAAFDGREGVSEKRMFGGLTFLLRGKMVCGVQQHLLMVRVGPDAHDAALRLPGARDMDFTGRPMKGMVYVERDGYESDASLRSWIERGTAFAESLPAKDAATKAKRGRS